MAKQIIFLNGPSSSGKSTLSRALKTYVKEHHNADFSIVSIDDFLKMTTSDTIYEDDVFEISGQLCQKVLEDMNIFDGVIIDHVITSERIYNALIDTLKAYPILKIKVTCPAEVLRAREMARGDRCVGSAEASLQYLYPQDEYDLIVDTHNMTPDECVASICGKLGKSATYYHASQICDIKTLEPRVSNHGIPLIYFSRKRENVLVYLSNAVEKYCIESGFAYDGVWQKWASYGFDKDGRQHIDEYYPDALIKTYKGVSGYIYTAEKVDEVDFQTYIPDSAVSATPVEVAGAEFIPDALEAILEAEKQGLIVVTRYNELTEKKRAWIESTVKSEYAEAENHPDYRHFLLNNFPDILG